MHYCHYNEKELNAMLNMAIPAKEVPSSSKNSQSTNTEVSLAFEPQPKR